MGYLIGADIGSQSVKAVLLDPDGQTAATAGRRTMQHPAAAGPSRIRPAGGPA